VQTKGLYPLAALRYKPFEIPLPLHLLPPQAWAWAKALLCEQQQHGRSISPDENLGAPSFVSGAWEDRRVGRPKEPMLSSKAE
jgi:hypothetical protein